MNKQQEAHPAAVAQEFMRRSDMKGGEVEAFASTFHWLARFLDGEVVAITREAHFALTEELEELRTFRKEHEPAPDDAPVDELEDVDSEDSD